MSINPVLLAMCRSSLNSMTKQAVVATPPPGGPPGMPPGAPPGAGMPPGMPPGMDPSAMGGMPPGGPPQGPPPGAPPGMPPGMDPGMDPSAGGMPPMDPSQAAAMTPPPADPGAVAQGGPPGGDPAAGAAGAGGPPPGGPDPSTLRQIIKEELANIGGGGGKPKKLKPEMRALMAIISGLRDAGIPVNYDPNEDSEHGGGGDAGGGDSGGKEKQAQGDPSQGQGQDTSAIAASMMPGGTGQAVPLGTLSNPGMGADPALAATLANSNMNPTGIPKVASHDIATRANAVRTALARFRSMQGA